LNLDSLFAAAAKRDFRPVATGLRAAVQIPSRLRRVRSENVVARLPGSDPALANQPVLVTAHWDHLGVGPIVAGDSIYNGAEDNASGVAALLASALTLSRGPRPRRPIIFIATTAEESGLLGSEAYVRAPLLPLETTAAVLNLDGMNVRGATRDIAALGADRSSLGPMFSTAALVESLTVSKEPDERGLFFRSDHFPFARAGVPALSLESGLNFVGRPAGWGKLQDSIWTANRYHQPSDQYDPAFRMDGLAQQVRVTVRVARDVANAATLPQWLPTAEFRRRSTP
jgi:Zn-dependent M28 family amino/carboxypeptidase